MLLCLQKDFGQNKILPGTVKSPKLSIFYYFIKKYVLECSVRARQKYFHHHIFHKILHLLDIFNEFISLKLIAVDGFEVARYLKEKHEEYFKILMEMKEIPLKILIDEMDDGMDERLQNIGYDAHSVKKLRADGLKLHTDYSVINYAKKNDMILVTRDTESGQACDENNIPYVLLDSDEIFKIVLEKLKQF